MPMGPAAELDRCTRRSSDVPRVLLRADGRRAIPALPIFAVVLVEKSPFEIAVKTEERYGEIGRVA
jgi:hypothetical protein